MNRGQSTGGLPFVQNVFLHARLEFEPGRRTTAAPAERYHGARREMSLWTDLLYSVRSLARTPLLTSALLLTIALGIGSNATIAGVVNGLYTSRLPLAAADRTFVLVAGADATGPNALDADRLSVAPRPQRPLRTVRYRDGSRGRR